ncbi:MAG: nucleoside deaminase [Deltaproteobacteria bacterium]|nr:nucleoside deaminase [Deltaproteobacteria bacterium]
MSHETFMQKALEQAQKSLSEGGIPIGSVLVIDNKIVGAGHNQRVQQKNPILHGEMDCLQNAGRLSAKDYKKSTLYTTLSPCAMCSGTVLLYEIPTVVLAENHNFKGEEELLKSRGVQLINLDLPEAKTMMADFITNHPELWNEDIGE